MELRHVLGSTYVAVAATALLPIYKLNDTDIVLLDTGYAKLDRSEYDVIILGYHKGIPPVNRFARHILFESFGGKSTPRRNTESLMAAAEKGHADIISHPNLYLTLDIPYLADCARQLGILLEINSSHVSLTPEEIKTIHEHGAGLIIGSDAHVSSRVGDFANGIESAKQAGVLNSVVNIEL